MKEYTYEDWLKGIVCLDTCATAVPKEKTGSFARVNINSFNRKDADKIKAKQRELFAELKDKELSRLQRIFVKQYKASNAKEQLIKSLIQRYYNVMYGEFDHNLPSIDFPPGTFNIETSTLIEIQYFINQYITYGDERDVSSIHSPNFEFKSNNLHPYIYAQVIFEFHKWLQNKGWKEHDIVNCSHRSIIIAHKLLGITINKRNAQAILLKYSTKVNPERLLKTHIFYKAYSQLSPSNDMRRRADHQLIKDLSDAKYIISCTKNTKAKKEINDLLVKLNNEFLERYGTEVRLGTTY